MYILFLLFLISAAHCLDTTLCSSMVYGRYCGINHTSKYGEKPIDELDEICHKHDVCTAIGLTDRWCNCQMVYFSMNIKTNAEDMRECMIYYGSLACGIYYSYGYSNNILIPDVAGWNYYTIFSSYDETIYLNVNKTMYYNIFDDYDTYIFYTILASNDPDTFKKIGIPFINADLILHNGSILVISNHQTTGKVTVTQRKHEYIVKVLNDTLNKITSELANCKDTVKRNNMYINGLEFELTECNLFSNKINSMIVGCAICCFLCIFASLLFLTLLISGICCFVYKKRKW